MSGEGLARSHASLRHSLLAVLSATESLRSKRINRGRSIAVCLSTKYDRRGGKGGEIVIYILTVSVLRSSKSMPSLSEFKYYPADRSMQVYLRSLKDVPYRLLYR